MSKKVLFEVVKSEFNKKDYLLLSTEDDYLNNKVKLKYRCPIHSDAIQEITYSRLKHRNQGCYYCALKKKGEYKRFEYEDVKNMFLKKNYTLLSDKYKNRDHALKYVCKLHPEIGEQKVSLASLLLTENNCKLCKRESRGRGNSHFWKGGVTELSDYLRTLQIVYVWKAKSLQAHDYKCFITNVNSSDLVVHHVIPFHFIRDDILHQLNLPIHEKIADYSKEELEKITTLFSYYHTEHLGAVMLSEIHQEFHSVYGYSATYEDLIEYKNNYTKGNINAN